MPHNSAERFFPALPTAQSGRAARGLDRMPLSETIKLFNRENFSAARAALAAAAGQLREVLAQ
ncbi:MAG: hypothetical protein PHW69_04870 [Elusimicrobiaceae bacterium]|nr:hypothetical protein [Elusimicrobiaceae bacterium]